MLACYTFDRVASPVTITTLVHHAAAPEDFANWTSRLPKDNRYLVDDVEPLLQQLQSQGRGRRHWSTSGGSVSTLKI
jgi:hypothetical protein